MEESQFPNISNKQYHNFKYKLKKLEASNCNRIIAIPCSGSQNWYEIAEHSALFYYYDVCQQLNLKTKFFADTISVYDQYEIGYMRAKGVDNIRQNLKNLNLYRDEHRDGEIYIFVLKNHYTEKRIAELKNREHARRLQNLTPFPANNLDPELHHMIVTVTTRLHRVCNSRLDKLSSQTIGTDIVQLADNLLETYHIITMLDKDQKSKIKSYLTEMRKDIYQLIIKVQILGEAKLWDLELCSSISNQLEEVKKRIERNINHFAKKGKI